MILYLGLTITVVFLAYFVNNRIQVQPGMVARQQMCNRVMLALIFLLLFGVSACRYYVGNDYSGYISIFRDLHLGSHVSTEIGFNWVVYAVQFLFGTGEVSARIIFALFSAGTVYFMVRALYDQSDWFVFSVFLLMTNGYYFSSMTSVRYYFVLSIALYAMKYAQQKRWIKFVCWIVFAALFHKSILFVIPVYFLATINWGKWHVALLAAASVSFVFGRDLYRWVIFKFYPYYENSVFDDGQTSLVNILKCLAVVMLVVLYFRVAVKDRPKQKFYFMLNLWALILYSFCSFIPEISRIGYYLNVTNVFLLPAVLKEIPNKKWRIFWSVSAATGFMLYFILFMYKAYDVSIRLLPYESWLFR